MSTEATDGGMQMSAGRLSINSVSAFRKSLAWFSMRFAFFRFAIIHRYSQSCIVESSEA
jgi:hypothetical protein